MDELVKEHIIGRENTRKLVEARNKYLAGEKDSVKAILENMAILAKFYPKHIEKEDKNFFLPVMNYFIKEEQCAMLNEFYEFDRKFIHVKYNDIVSDFNGIKKEMKI
jgi:hemerythrin-like domain-containing protein